MAGALDVNGSSILKTHPDPRPHPGKAAPHPPDGFHILKPPGAWSGGRERRGQDPPTPDTRRRPAYRPGSGKNIVMVPNAQQRHAFRPGRYLMPEPNVPVRDCGDAGPRAGSPGPREMRASPAERLPPAAPATAEGMWAAGGTGLWR